MRLPRTLRRDARIFGIGAAAGSVASAVVVTLLVWHYGHLVGLRDAPLVTTVGGSGAQRYAPDEEAGTVGTAGGPSLPAPSPEPAFRPPAGHAPELAARALEIPVEGISADQLTRSFDDARGERSHRAIDIMAARHTPVRAVEDGRIVRLFLSRAGGITLYQFDPTETYCYYYAHLESYAEGIVEGQRVRRGQVIGYVGSSGNAAPDAPHLHFAVFRLTPEKRWWEGTPIDPYDLLVR